MKRDTNFDSSHPKVCTVSNAQLLNSLTADATVCCSKCGARAHDPASLCSPMPIPGSGPIS